MSFEVRDPLAEVTMRKIADRITAELPPGYGFALFLAQTDKENGNFFYISNVERGSILPAFKAWLKRQVM